MGRLCQSGNQGLGESEGIRWAVPTLPSANASWLLAPERPAPPALLLCWPLLSAPPSASLMAEPLSMRTNYLKAAVTPEKAFKPQAMSSGPCEPRPPTKGHS